jgi:dipeptidyl aminopeptidase/acylaminoacyl peptidase
MRLAAWIALGLSAVLPTAGQAEPFTPADLGRLESFGSVLVDPTGRWLVFEQRDAAGAAARFDDNDWNRWGLNRLRLVDLRAPGAPRPLIDDARGYVAGTFSPDGNALLVARFSAHRWTAGVVALPGGAFKALPLAPDSNLQGQTVAWRSNHEILMIAKPPGEAPEELKRGWAGPARTTALWARQAEGLDSSVAVGSGRYRDQRPQATANRLVSIDIRTGAARELARGDLDDLAMDPSGRRLAFVARGQDLQPAADETLDVAAPPRRRRLSMVDLTTGAVSTSCPDLDLSIATLSWSPDGQRLVVHARREGQPWSKAQLLALGADGSCNTPAAPGVALPPAASPALPAPVQMAWSGDQLLVRGHRAGDAGGRQDWMASRDGRAVALTAALPAPPERLLLARPGQIWVLAAGQVWRVQAGGAAQKVGPPHAQDGAFAERFWSLAYVIGEPAYPRVEGRQPVAAVHGAGVRRRLSRPGSAWRELALRRAALTPVAWAGGGGDVVAISRDDHGVETLSLVTARGEIPLAVINTWLAQRPPFQVAAVAHRGPNGEALKSWVYLPADWRPGRRLPLIVAPYPGAVHAQPSASPGAPNSPVNVAILTGRGYAVLETSLPRQAGREPAEGLADQILAIVDQAVARGYADDERLALWGHSYGGWAGLITATQTDRFKAIIASAGVSNALSAHGVFTALTRPRPDAGLAILPMAAWAEAGQGRLGAAPWVQPGPYLRNSPLMSADKITTPLLILHGDQDFVSLTQAEEMFSALYRQNKDAMLVTYFGEEHQFDSPGNVEDVYRRVFSWLDETLSAPASSVGTADRRSPPPTAEPTPPASPPPTDP